MKVKKSLKRMLLSLILLSIALSTIISSFFITVNFYLDYKSSVISAAKKVSEKVSDDINKIISLGLTINDVPALENDLKEKIKYEKTINYIIITDKDSNVIFSTHEELKNKKFNVNDGDEAVVGGFLSINLKTPIYDLEKKPVYFINNGLKSAVLKQKVYGTVFLLIITSLITIAASFGISKKILDTRVFEPLMTLKDSTDKVSEGNLSVTLSSSYEDEVGLVTENFSLMVSSLREIIENIRDGIYQLSMINDITEELSHRVKEGSEKQLMGTSKINSAFINIENRVKSLKERLESLNEFIELTSSTFLEISSSSEEIFKIMGDLKKSVERIDETYENYKNINVKLDDSIDRLYKEIERILSFVNQIDESIKNTLQNIMNTSDLSDKMSELAIYSKKTIRENMKSVERMADISAESMGSFLLLKKNLEKISNILNVIEEIAEQTNMLALNAAIIAAQTEETGGKAFAVVAEEIKGLSKRTQASTKEIAEIIDSITEQTQNVFTKLNENSKEAGLAAKKAKEVEENIGEIISMVEKVTISIKGVLKSANEQSAGSNTLSREVEDLKNVSNVLVSVKEESNQVISLLGDLVDLISKVVTKVSGSVKEQNTSITNLKKSVVDLTNFSKQLTEYITKEKEEISETRNLISEIEKMALENNKQAKSLEDKLVELNNLNERFSILIRRFKS